MFELGDLLLENYTCKSNLNSLRSKLMVSGSILKTRLNFSGRWQTKRKGSYENAAKRRPCNEALPGGQWAALGSSGQHQRNVYHVAREPDA